MDKNKATKHLEAAIITLNYCVNDWTIHAKHLINEALDTLGLALICKDCRGQGCSVCEKIGHTQALVALESEPSAEDVRKYIKQHEDMFESEHSKSCATLQHPKDPARVNDCDCALAALESEPDLLKDFLAIIHRDGGHHTAEVGLEQSIEDAKQIYYRLRDKSEPCETCGGSKRVPNEYLRSACNAGTLGTYEPTSWDEPCPDCRESEPKDKWEDTEQAEFERQSKPAVSPSGFVTIDNKPLWARNFLTSLMYEAGQPVLRQKHIKYVISIIDSQAATIKSQAEQLHRHEGVEGGIAAKCGHPVQCLYAAAEIDGGPVCCTMCDRDKKIGKQAAELKELNRAGVNDNPETRV